MKDEKEKPIVFEKGMEELEKMTEEIESGKLTLDEMLKRYEQSVKVSRQLQTRLDEARDRIEVLVKEGGAHKAKAFKAEE